MDWIKSHPWWAVGIAGVVLLGIWWYESHKSSSSATTVGTTPVTTTVGTTPVTTTVGTTPVTTRGRRGRTGLPGPPPPQPVPHKAPQPVPPPVPHKTVPVPPRTHPYVPVKPPAGAKHVQTLGTPVTSYTGPSGPIITTTTTTPQAQEHTTTTTGQLAYSKLSSLGYNPSAASAVATQIAAGNSGVPAGTPQLVAGIPVVAGSTAPVGSNGITPQQYAAQKAAAAAAAAKNAAPFSVPAGQTYVGGNQQQYQIAQTLSVPPSSYSYQGGWLYGSNGQPLSKAQAASVANTFGTGITTGMLTSPPPGVT